MIVVLQMHLPLNMLFISILLGLLTNLHASLIEISSTSEYKCDSDGSCNDDTIVCLASSCRVKCEGGYCKRTLILSSKTFYLECDDGCDDTEFYCGDLSLASETGIDITYPSDYSSSDFTVSSDNSITCTVEGTNSNGWTDGTFGCFGSGIDECTMTASNDNGVNGGTFICDTQWTSGSASPDCDVSDSQVEDITMECYAYDDATSQCNCGNGCVGINYYYPPTNEPTTVPTIQPTNSPNNLNSPSFVPTSVPSDIPSGAPTDTPNVMPTGKPSVAPTDVPDTETTSTAIGTTKATETPTMTATAGADTSTTTITTITTASKGTIASTSLHTTSGHGMETSIDQSTQSGSTVFNTDSDSSDSDTESSQSIGDEILTDVEWIVGILLAICICGVCLFCVIIFYKRKIHQAEMQYANINFNPGYPDRQSSTRTRNKKSTNDHGDELNEPLLETNKNKNKNKKHENLNQLEMFVKGNIEYQEGDGPEGSPHPNELSCSFFCFLFFIFVVSFCFWRSAFTCICIVLLCVFGFITL